MKRLRLLPRITRSTRRDNVLDVVRASAGERDLVISRGNALGQVRLAVNTSPPMVPEHAFPLFNGMGSACSVFFRPARVVAAHPTDLQLDRVVPDSTLRDTGCPSFEPHLFQHLLAIPAVPPSYSRSPRPRILRVLFGVVRGPARLAVRGVQAWRIVRGLTSRTVHVLSHGLSISRISLSQGFSS